jgi:lipopolysaccharide/colanic/teichoic acid biosynthesis glycosyltransferase
MFYRSILKPTLDFVAALLALVTLSPVFLVLIAAVRLDSRGPAFFLQKRLGKGGKVFTLLKFRSMYVHQNGQGNADRLRENDPRITKVGAFIRKTSLDELPQIVNILKGDMSFIGPRPPVPHYPKSFEEYDAKEKNRFLVRPGISGLAQVRCREVHDWSINIPIDVEYVERQSFLLDLRLFVSSLVVFFRTNNIYAED